MGDFGKNMVEIMTLFIVAAIIAMLVSHYQGTTSIIGQSGQTFGNLLSIVENPGSPGQGIQNNGFMPFTGSGGLGFGSSGMGYSIP